MNLRNCKIFHEPYSQCYYFGAERQSQRYGEQSPDPNATYRSVSKILQKEYDGKEVLFAKDMAYHIQNHFHILLEEGFKNVQHSFLIRQPKRAIPSLYKASTNPKLTGWDHFDPVEAGFRQMNELFQFVRSHLDPSPVVVDADDLLCNPEGILRSYCEALGLSFQDGMTRWNPGPVPEWDTWTGWHEDALKSSGFTPRRNQGKKDGDVCGAGHLPKEVIESIEQSVLHFEPMYAMRIHPRNSHTRVEL